MPRPPRYLHRIKIYFTDGSEEILENIDQVVRDYESISFRVFNERDQALYTETTYSWHVVVKLEEEKYLVTNNIPF